MPPGPGIGPTPSVTSGYWPVASTCVIVPNDALVSIAIAWLPFPMPSRLSNWLVPLSGLVSARPSLTMLFIHAKSSRPVLTSLNTALVARPLRPLLLVHEELVRHRAPVLEEPGIDLEPEWRAADGRPRS